MTNIDTSHRFGIVAVEDIRSNETLVEIPRSIALTSSQSSIASRLESFKERQIDRFLLEIAAHSLPEFQSCHTYLNGKQLLLN